MAILWPHFGYFSDEMENNFGFSKHILVTFDTFKPLGLFLAFLLSLAIFEKCSSGHCTKDIILRLVLATCAVTTWLETDLMMALIK